MKRYDVSDKYGYIREAEACGILIKELEHIQNKLKKKISKQVDKRKSEMEKIVTYHSEQEIQDDYGYGLITEKQYEHYVSLYQKSQEYLDEPLETKETVALSILNRILSDLDLEKRQNEFDALSPEEQAEQRRIAVEKCKKWEQHKIEIKKEIQNGRNKE